MRMLDELLEDLGRDSFEDFTRRWERGAPWEALRDEEAIAYYDRIVEEIGPPEFQEAALASLERLSREERRELVGEMQRNARREDLNYPGVHDEGIDEPQALAALLARMHAERRGGRLRYDGTAAKPERSDAAAERMARARFSERSAASVRGNVRQHGPSKPRRIL